MSNGIYEPIYNRDWLSAFLKRSRLKPLGAALILTVLNILVNGALAYRSGTWISGSAGTGLFNDYPVLVTALLFQPTVIATFCWLPIGMQRLYEGIAREGVFETEADLIHSYERLRKSFQNPFLVPFAVGWAIFSCLIEYYVFFHPLMTSWMLALPEAFWFRLPLEFLFYFMLPMGFYDFLVVLMAVRKLFRDKTVRIQPFHPDRAGGLGAVGGFTANIGYAVGAVGLSLSATLFQGSSNTTLLYNILIGLMFLIYFTMAPIGFYFPLWSAHNAMLSYRDALVRSVSAEFDLVHAKLSLVRSEEAARNEPLLKRIQQLSEERDLLYRFPVWPFDASSLRKFFSLALSPLVPILTSQLLNLFSKWLP